MQPLTGGVVGQLGAPDDVEIPLRKSSDCGVISVTVRAVLFRPCSWSAGLHAFESRLPLPAAGSPKTRATCHPPSWRALARKRGVSSVYRRGAGNRSGSGRRGSPRGAAPRARSAGRPSRCSPRARRRVERLAAAIRASIARHAGSRTASARVSPRDPGRARRAATSDPALRDRDGRRTPRPARRGDDGRRRTRGPSTSRSATRPLSSRIAQPARAEHQSLEQRVAREPVRAVHAGARHLARRIQAGIEVRPSRSVCTPPMT